LTSASPVPVTRRAARAAGAVPVRVAVSESRLNQIKSALDRHDAGVPAVVTRWYVDLPGNQVVVVTRPGGLAAARHLVAASGTGTANVRIVTSTERPEPTYDVHGGDAYYIGLLARCSSVSPSRAASSPPVTAPR